MGNRKWAICLFVCVALVNGCKKRGAGEGSGGAVPVVTKSGIEMVYVPAGVFTMGSNGGNPDEAPAHKVTVSAFLIDKCEVTQSMMKAVQLPDGSKFAGEKRPVERIRWRDAKAYCNERSRAEGLRPCYNEKMKDWDCDYSADGYRLPTEAEWEYAAKAGVDGPYDFGSADKLRQYAWYAEDSDQKTHDVGTKQPNRWGIYDMYGNVSEWCEDVYDPAYYKSSPAADPHGPASPGKDVKRVLRGGSWKSSAAACRATFRQGERTGDTDACFATDYCGFRCVRSATMEQVASLKKP